MRIKTRIQLGIILSLILTATIALLLFLGGRAVNEASRLEGIAVEVIKGVAEMKIVTHEYLLHPEERSLMQWRSRYGSLSKLLTGSHFKDPDEKIAADQIFKNLERFKTVFSDLATGLRKGETPGNQESAAFRELQDRLMDELLMKSRLAVSLAFRLQQKIEAKLMTTRKMVSFLTLLLLLTLTAAITGISLWVNRSIARPIAKLEKDAQIIGSGNLDHEVGTTAKDEIGELSRAFDKMTQDLKETTTSIVELNKEIAERKAAEEAVRESEERYRSLIETITDIVFIISPNGNLTYLNPEFEKLTGYPVQDVIGHAFTEVLAPEYIESTVDRFTRGLSGETILIYEVELKQKDGKTAPVELKVTSLLDDDGKTVGRIGLARDISERKRAEEALRKSESSLSRAQTVAHLGNWEYDSLTGKITWFGEAYRIFGFAPQELDVTTDLIQSMIHPEDRNRVETALEDVQGVFGQQDLEYRIIRRDGTVRHVHSQRDVSVAEEVPVRIFGTLQDITDRKRAEEALWESEEKYRSMMEAMKDPVYICSPDFRVEYMNPAMIQRRGHEATGEICFKALHDLEEKCPWCMHDKAQQGEYLEFEIVSPKDNRSYYISQSTVAHGDGSVSNMTIFRDITEMRETEAQLYRAQKMEAMGLLAGGVAHDLNNILSGIVSYPELILMDLPEDSPLRRPIKVMQESGMRAADVVEDLLTIARGVATGKEALNLNTLINEYLESPEYQTLEKTHSFVNFETELDPDLLNMSGSPTHIKKTLMNLIVNASEAIEGTGTVTISSMNRYLDEPLNGYAGIRTGEYAVLTVSDDGSGITPKDLERIFEPFYTKKVMGRSGTGLGLAVVWNTVQDHKGYINVESSEKGTVFELYFPVTRKEVFDEKEKIPLENYLGHGEKILVVDDEARQRVIACGILTKLGYTAEAVSSGEEAIEYMKENTVDLIVLDMVMPKGINGRETYQQIIKIRPGQKAVIASGYAKTKEVDLAQELGAGKYIKKPYTLEKIGVAVKKELEK